MSEYIPKDGSLDVSKTVHDFMFTIEYDPKKLVFDQLKLFSNTQKIEIFKLGFSIGYVNGIFFKNKEGSKNRKTVAPRGFPMAAYRMILEEEAIQRKMSIGALISAYADAGLLHLKSHIDSGKDLMELMKP